MNTTQISAAKTTELVAFYNLHAASHGLKPVAKFADRKTAERRVAELAAKVEAAQAAAAAAAKPASKAAAKKAPADRSAAISRSWEDKVVAAKRATHHKVVVDGSIYRSVRAAFEALGLPLGSHIKFRMELKSAGAKKFADHSFSIVAA